MAKGKALVPQTIVRSFNRRTGLTSPEGGCSLLIKCVGGDLVVGEKHPPPMRYSLRQLAQQAKYCNCDYYLRTGTLGQLILWESYYWRDRYLGRTRRLDSEHDGTTEIGDTGKDVGYHAYFMKKCMLWNLLDYFYNWLKARWKLTGLTLDEEGVTVSAQVCHRDDVTAPQEPREPRLERIRWL